jgi:hypothetical protein
MNEWMVREICSIIHLWIRYVLSVKARIGGEPIHTNSNFLLEPLKEIAAEFKVKLHHSTH